MLWQAIEGWSDSKMESPLPLVSVLRHFTTFSIDSCCLTAQHLPLILLWLLSGCFQESSFLDGIGSLWVTSCSQMWLACWSLKTGNVSMIFIHMA